MRIESTSGAELTNSAPERFELVFYCHGDVAPAIGERCPRCERTELFVRRRRSPYGPSPIAAAWPIVETQRILDGQAAAGGRPLAFSEPGTPARDALTGERPKRPRPPASGPNGESGRPK